MLKTWPIPSAKRSISPARGGPARCWSTFRKTCRTPSPSSSIPKSEIILPGYRPPQAADEDQIQAALELIESAERPVILAGHGVMMSGATRELLQFAEMTQTPIALTLLGKGGVPEHHPLSLGMMGMHGTGQANLAIQNADLLLAFGMRFDDRVTGNLKTYAPNARKIHVDIDSSEIHKNVRADVPIVGDLKTVLEPAAAAHEAHRAQSVAVADPRLDGRRRRARHRQPGCGPAAAGRARHPRYVGQRPRATPSS